MKKIGIETPATATAMIDRSTSVPRLTAAMVPSVMPIGIANSMPAIISSSVGPMVELISSITILLEMIERPRSPCITRQMYSANWTMIGRSSPSSRRMAAIVSAFASGPAMIAAGSAGTTCIRQKHRNSTPSSAGSEIKSRWTICRPISNPPDRTLERARRCFFRHRSPCWRSRERHSSLSRFGSIQALRLSLTGNVTAFGGGVKQSSIPMLCVKMRRNMLQCYCTTV